MRSIFILLFLLINLSVRGADYYIATAANGGSNANNGSIGSPWLTLAYACSQVGSGNTINIGAGTFALTSRVSVPVGVSLKGAGTPYTGITSIITSNISTEFYCALLLESASEGTNGNQHITMIKFDGLNETGWGAIMVQARSNVDISYCEFVDFHNMAVTFNGGASYLETAPTTYAIGNEFHHNTVNNCSYFPRGTDSGEGALKIGGQDGMIIASNHITQTTRPDGYNGYCIKYYSSGYNKGLIIDGNVLTKAPFHQFYDNASWDFAIELWYSQGGIEIRNNIIIGAIDMSNPAKGDYEFSCKIHNNVIGPESYNTLEEHGIYFEVSATDVLVYNNYFRNLSNPIYIGTIPVNFSNFYIYNNIMEGIGTAGQQWVGWGIRWVGVEGSTVVHNINILNNVIWAAPGVNGNIATDYLMGGIMIPTSNNCTEINIKNNIIQGFGYYGGVYGLGGSGNTTDYLSVTNNLFYENGRSNLTYLDYSPTNYVNQDNIIDNPDLIGGSPFDFRLTSTSPCIGAGIGVGINYDWDAAAYAASPSIGAFEYAAADITATDILTFTVANQVGATTVNATAHTVTLRMPFETNLTALQPIITLSPLATVSPTSGTATNFTNPVNYTVTAGDETTTQVWAVTITNVDPSTNTDILSFSLPEQTGAESIDLVNHTVGITVAIGTTVTALTPTVTVYTGASISPVSGAATNFTNPVTYTVTAQDASTQAWVITVTVAQGLAVVTNSARYLSSINGFASGNVTDDGGTTVTAKGFCWSTSINPTVSNSITVNGTGEGAFTSSLSPLLSNLTYYVRAYAVNSEGTSYGANVSFTTPKYSVGKTSGKVGYYNGKIGVVK